MSRSLNLSYRWDPTYGIQPSHSLRITHSVIINSTKNTSANANQILANYSRIARPFLVHKDNRILNPRNIFYSLDPVVVFMAYESWFI